MNYNKQDYTFVSSRIFSLETKILTKDKLNILADATNDTEIVKLLDEYGIQVKENLFGEKEFENAFSLRLENSFKNIMKDVPNPELFTIYTYPYDCHNIKSAIKCIQTNSDPLKLMIPLGSLSPELIIDAINNKKFEVLPKNMASAAEFVLSEYPKSKNPQMIDLYLDTACYKDLNESIKDIPFDFFTNLLKAKADTANIFTCYRLLKLKNSVDMMTKAFVDGGSISLEFFTKLFSAESPIEMLAFELKNTQYSNLSSEIIKNDNISVIGKACDKIRNDIIYSYKDELIGPEVVAYYFTRLENEIKNLRLLVASKKAGINSEKIKEMF